MKNKDNIKTIIKELPVVEQFYTIQGEGFHTGKPAFFIRIGGCDVCCSWCDTRFAWNPDLHGLVSVDSILLAVENSGADSVVITGGEPLMWNLDYLCSMLKNKNITTFLETSGAYELSGSWDWICLSPKKNMPPFDNICSLAGELKVVIEKQDDFDWAEEYKEKVNPDCKLFLQPEWSRLKIILPEIIEYVKENTEWSVSLQSHKFMGIP